VDDSTAAHGASFRGADRAATMRKRTRQRVVRLSAGLAMLGAIVAVGIAFLRGSSASRDPPPEAMNVAPTLPMPTPAPAPLEDAASLSSPVPIPATVASAAPPRAASSPRVLRPLVTS